MNRTMFILVFLAGCCAPAPSPTVDPVPAVEVVGPLTVEGKSSCAVGESIELRAKGDATWVDWASESPHLGPYEAGRILTFSSPTAGRYVFWLFGDVGGKPAKVKHVVMVGGTPIPPPGPGPTPPTPIPVPPAPVVGPLKLFVVYESQQTTPEFSRMSTALRAGPEAAYLKAKGHSLEFLDPDVHAAQLAKVGLPGKADVPFLGIINSAGQVVARQKLESKPGTPVTGASVLDLIKKAGG